MLLLLLLLLLVVVVLLLVVVVVVAVHGCVVVFGVDVAGLLLGVDESVGRGDGGGRGRGIVLWRRGSGDGLEGIEAGFDKHLA